MPEYYGMRVTGMYAYAARQFRVRWSLHAVGQLSRLPARAIRSPQDQLQFSLGLRKWKVIPLRLSAPL